VRAVGLLHRSVAHRPTVFVGDERTEARQLLDPLVVAGPNRLVVLAVVDEGMLESEAGQVLLGTEHPPKVLGHSPIGLDADSQN
jgi:hypothetical protein